MELHNRATSIKDELEERLFKRVKDYLDAKQPGEDASALNNGTGEEGPPKSPADNQNADAGGHQPPDDEDLDQPGGYAGYKHHTTNEK